MTDGNQSYPERLHSDLKEIQAAINSAIASGPAQQHSIDRIYALLHNTKVQGETGQFPLVSNICALACGILQRTKNPEEATWRAVKAHIDALAIIAEHNVEGDGGDLGRRMVEELRELGQAVGA
ncbi:MAG: hypothetical protein HOK82_21395 [Rhodospirillaceae bacterium]|nr:hypothetical protein [Rhodospirillaceae bacterium]